MRQFSTSTGDTQVYSRHSRFRFSADGRDSELTIYEGPNGFFLPFVDSLAGQETYPAGRYLEPEPLPGGRFLMVVWVPGWTMFLVANVLSFHLTRPAAWKALASEVGFVLRDEGNFGGMYYQLLEKPA